MLRSVIASPATSRLLLAAGLALAAGGCRLAAPPQVATSPAARPAVVIPADARVRATLAGHEGGWLLGRWVTTSAGCVGVLLTEEQLLAPLPTLTALEVAVPGPAGGVERWRPVVVSDIRDGEGCEPGR